MSVAPNPRGMLPQNRHAERAVLGGILLRQEKLHEVRALLNPDDFYHPAHQLIFQSMIDVEGKGSAIDPLTVSAELLRRELLGRVEGGEGYLVDLLNEVPTAENIAHYARIVREQSTLRQLIHTTREISAQAMGDHGDFREFLDSAEKRVFEVARQSMTSNYEHVRALLPEAIRNVERRRANGKDVTGVPTGFGDLDKLLSGLQPNDLVLLAARPSMGKCLTARMLIDDPDTGERVTIEECVRRCQTRVFGVADDGSVRATAIGDWIDSGVKAAFGVRTRTGRYVEVTGHHPFLTVAGWKPLSELGIGSSIGIPRQVPAFGRETPKVAHARLMAYFIAEGGLTSACPKFTNTDPEIVSDFLAIIDAEFPQCHVKQYGIDYAVTRPEWRGKQEPNPVTKWLRDLGLMGKKSEQKSFPARIWSWTRESLIEFMRALMSCDGTVYSMGGYPRIEFAVASEALAQDVHHAFVRLGIVSKFWRKSERCWRVEITEPESVERYQREIGWIGEKAKRFGTDDASVRRSNVGHIPREVWDAVLQGCDRLGISMIELARRAGETEAKGHLAGYNRHMRRHLPRRRLEAYARVLEDPQLARLAHPDLYWDEIVEITPLGEQQVYDLTVPDGANFIAQDVCVHNTSLALSFALNSAVHGRIPVLFFSLEMGSQQLVERMLCSEGRIDSNKLRSGHMASHEWINLTKAASRLMEAPISIDDSSDPSVLEIRAKSRRWASDPTVPRGEGPLRGVILVDYVQLVKSGGTRREDSREREISDVSRGLKALAKDLHMPIVALAQLNRGLEKREDKRPILSDLRESGALEQDADVIMFIYRDDYYNKEKSDKPGVAEVIIGKHRNGPTGTVDLRWSGEHTRFDNLSLRED